MTGSRCWKRCSSYQRVLQKLPATDIIVVGDSDDDDDEWLVASDHNWVRSDPFKPLVMDIKDDPFWSYTPSTPPTPVYELFTGTWTLKTWHQPSTPSHPRYKDKNEDDDAEFIQRVRLGWLVDQATNGPFQGHQIFQKESLHI
ncbi:hypothetical protein SNE40_008880 [Patella caerulea]|uniref:Uncharacterized protein n=1 Tax=Patella caerulea TaxID=87958 RepID=A0AAN8Q297_PATCE